MFPIRLYSYNLAKFIPSLGMLLESSANCLFPVCSKRKYSRVTSIDRKSLKVRNLSSRGVAYPLNNIKTRKNKNVSPKGKIKKKYLPSPFYREVYVDVKAKSLDEKHMLANFSRLWFPKKKLYSGKAYARSFFESNLNDRSDIAMKKVISPLISNVMELTFSRFNLDKLFTKSRKGGSLKLWKAKRKWAWRYLKRIHAGKKLSQAYARINHWSFTRLGYAYMYDIFIFWFLFYIIKIRGFLYKYFHSLWVGIYLIQASSFSLVSFSNYDCFTSISYFSYCHVLKNARVAMLKNRDMLTHSIVTYHKPYIFTRFFKLMATYWNRYRRKHSTMEIASWRWKRKFKYGSRAHRLGRKWRRKLRIKYFFSKKYLRIRFRKQHGYGLVYNYFLCSQLKRLKKLVFKKSSISLRNKQAISKYYNSSNRKIKAIVDKDHHLRRRINSKHKIAERVLTKRIKFIENIIEFKYKCLESLSQKTQYDEYKELTKQIYLLKELRNSIAAISHRQFNIDCVLLVLISKGIVNGTDLRNLASSDMQKQFSSNIWSFLRGWREERHDKLYSRIVNFSDYTKIMYIYKNIFFLLFKNHEAGRQYAYFEKLVLLHAKYPNKDPVFYLNLGKIAEGDLIVDVTLDEIMKERGVYYLGEIIIKLGTGFLGSVMGDNWAQMLCSIMLNRLYEDEDCKDAVKIFMGYLGERLVDLRDQGLKIQRRQRKVASYVQLRRKEQHMQSHRMYFYKRASFGALYNKLGECRLLLKCFKNTKLKNKQRRRQAKANRRKLLLAGGFKKVLWKSTGIPVLVSRVERHN